MNTTHVDEWTERDITWRVGQRVAYAHDGGTPQRGATGTLTRIELETYGDEVTEATLWVTWDGAPGPDAHGAHDLEPVKILAVGTRTQCTAHKGQHKGTVVHVFADGAYGVNWDDHTYGVRVADDFAEHVPQMLTCPADAIEAL